MPKVHHVKKARRALPDHDIKVGDSYYWWANRAPGSRSGFKRFSKTPPRPSQTVGSPYMQAAYAIEEGLDDCINLDPILTAEDVNALAQSFTEAAEEARSLGEETREKFDNMPEGLQQGDTGQLLEARADACEAVADELENAASELESWEPDEDCKKEDEIADAAQAAVEEAHSSISWDWGG